ncbi:MAG: hypothetical protein ACXQS8_06990, partial [Candidatus Helarchaeales archaeon]
IEVRKGVVWKKKTTVIPFSEIFHIELLIIQDKESILSVITGIGVIVLLKYPSTLPKYFKVMHVFAQRLENFTNSRLVIIPNVEDVEISGLL